MFKGKTILVTGGTGSFGKAFTEHLVKFYSNFNKLIVFSRDELKQSEMIQNKKFDHPNIRFILGDIKDYSDIRRATQNVDIIIHAAALKQVPTAEYNPFQFIKTNILGSQNIIEAALDNNVKNVVALSTDKASSPINLYGATKLCSEKLFIAANNIKGKQNISFSVVRYGNVMGSRGSVIPLFLKLNKNNKQLTLTDKVMTRFNITLKESIELVLSSLKNSREGEIFIPKIPSFYILDLIKAIAPNKKFKLIGVRPGEKIHEELISVYEGKSAVELKNYYAILPTIDQNIRKSYCLKKKCKTVAPNFLYTSANNKNFLKVSEIKKLLDVNFRD